MDWRPLVTALLLVGLTGAAIHHAPASPPDATDRALAYLAGQTMTPEIAEASAAAGQRPDTHTIRLAAPDPEHPTDGLRALHALLVAGVRVHPDPVRGTVDLADDLEARRAIVLAAPAASTLGFWLLSARILDAHADDAIEALVALQTPDGAFPCAGGYPSLDCTAFAVAALAAHDALDRADRTALTANILDHRAPGGGYTDGSTRPNAQTTAWTLAALQSLGETDPASDAWLRSLQRPDGHFARTADGSDAMAWWPTAEAVVWLEGGHPIRPLAPATAAA